MEVIFYIIIFLIFVLGPAIKKIFESSEESAPVESSSPNEVKEYLKRLRQRPEEQQKYHAPATRPPIPQQKNKRQQESSDEPLLSLDSSGYSSLAAAIKPSHGITKTSIPPRMPAADFLKQRVLQKSDLTDMKKAFILSEIFNRPRNLKQVIQENTRVAN